MLISVIQKDRSVKHDKLTDVVIMAMSAYYNVLSRPVHIERLITVICDGPRLYELP